MISVITPSVRPDGLDIIKKCLKRQDFDDYEWIVASPFEYKDCDLWLQDPPKEPDDFWGLCKAWNQAYAHAKGDLIVNIQDKIYFPHDTLSRFWFHYQNNPKALIGAIGHQYSDVDETGKPVNVVWNDPRWRVDISFQDVPPSEMEMTMCSIPRQALWDCGGIDEEYDKCNGAQEKEMCFRLRELGYKFYLDHTIEYRAIKHGRLTDDWDEVYRNKTTPIFIRHMAELENKVRTLNVNNLSKYLEK
jgi:glycosyltransferase involved in cell wall biosynthesis